jgi:hypothetical protein
VHRIKYTRVADIVDYFKEIHTLSRPIECTSLVTHIDLNNGCPEMNNMAYIEGDVPILGFSHFVHAHVLCEESNHSISMLYERGNKVLRLANQAYLSRSCDQLIVQLNTLENVHGSISRPPCTHRRAQREAAGQTPLRPIGTLGTGMAFRGIRRVVVHTILTVPLGQATEPEPPPLLSSPTGTTPSRGISVTGWIKKNVQWRGSSRTFEHVQMEIHASINSQTSMLHNLFDHFSMDPDG